MKIQMLEYSTKKPLANYKLQLFIKDNGYQNALTDENGFFELDDKFKGRQITPAYNGIQGLSFTANNGVSSYLDTKQTAKSTTKFEEVLNK